MKKILAIDDQLDNLTTVKAIIKSNMPDCEVITASSGKEGIEIAKNEQPDTILLDIIMPQMDGYEVCKRLKKDELTKHIPVIMLTAIKTDIESRVKGLEIGAEAFLYKPIDPLELKAQIKVMLRIKESEDRLREEKEELELIVKNRTQTLTEAQSIAEIGSWEYDVEKDLSYWSDEMYRLFDLDPKKITLHWLSLKPSIHPDDWERIDKKVQDAATKGISYCEEFRIIRANGETIWAETRGNAHKDKLGNIVKLSGTAQNITGRKIQEIELLKNQQLLKKAQEMGSIGTWELDLNLNILTWTEESYRIFGIPLGTPMTYELFLNQVHPDDRDFVNEAWTAGIKNKQYDIEHRLIVDGNLKWVREKAEFEYDKKGNTIKAIGFTQDISERKMADEFILQSEKRYRELVDTINSGVAVYKVINDGSKGSDYIIQDFNKTALTMEGMTKEEVVGKSLKDLRPNIDEYGLIPIFKKVWESGEATFYPAKEYHDNKYANYYENRVFRLPSGEIVAVFDDVTERENANLKIKESQERYDLAVNATQDGIYDWNLITNEIYYTPSWKSMLGYKDKELPNDFSVWEKLTEPEDVKKSWEMLQEVIEKKRDRFEMEFKMKHKDGHWVDVLSRAIAIFDDSGKAIRMIGTHIDITERKKSEKIIKEQNLEKSWMLKSMINAFVIFESVFDENNQFVSYRFQYINDAYEKITGVKNEIVFGKTVHEVWPNTEPEWIKRYGEVAVSGKSQSFELYHDPTKKLYYCNVYRPFGTAERFCVIFEDITERKRAEIALRESEEKYRSLFTNMIDGFAYHEIILDDNNVPIDYRFLEMNDVFEKMTGLKRSEILGEKVKKVLAGIEHDAVDWINLYGKVALSGESMHFETYSELFNKWYSIHAYSNKKGFFATNFEDITERKQSEEQIRLITERLHLSTESAGIGIWDLDLKNNILVWDKRMFELYGIQSTEFTGAYKAWKKGVHPEDISSADKEVQDAINGEKEFHSKFRVIWPDGQIRFIEAHAMVKFSDDGSAERMIGVNWDITESKMAELALKESESHLRTLVETIPDLVWMKDKNGIYLACNKRFEQFFGASSADIIGKTDYDFVDKELADFFKKMDKEAIDAGKSSRNEEEVEFANDGHREILETIKTPIYDDDGQIMGVLGVGRNITERKQAEIAIRESEEKYRSLMENLPVGVFRSTHDGQVISANPAMAKIYGYQSVEELLSLPAADYYHQDNPRDKMLKRLKKKGYLLGNETLENKKDGSHIWISANYKASFNTAGEIKYIDGVVIDITKRKETEKLLKESEEKHRTILKTASDGFWLCDNHGRLMEVNDSYCKMSGYSEEELLQMSISDLEFIETKSEVQNRIAEIIESSGEARFETKHRSKDGSSFDVEMSVQYQDIDGGRFVCFIHDISERKIADQKLLTALEKATESDRLKSAFLATMSHELRTPLNAIIGFSDIIDERMSKKDIVDFNKTINKSGNHLLSIVEDLFDITLIESGEIKLYKSNENLNSLLKEVHEVIKIEQQNTHKTILDLNLNLSNENQDIIVNTDVAKLKQILLNLLKNALKFTHKGSIQYGFSVEKNEENQYLKFYVKDSGIGISAENQEIIFEAFRQIEDTNTRLYGGTGIGLSISNKLVQLLGGDIWLESEEGVGSTFYFTIPMEEITERPESIKKQVKMKDDFNNKTILIVEDDESSFEFLKTILEKSDITILWAVNGQEALDYCKVHKEINLVLMDINMPVMNGYEATQQIKKINPHLPIIAQTAYAIAGDKEKILQAGCDDYISKPIKRETLLSMINTYINN